MTVPHTRPIIGLTPDIETRGEQDAEAAYVIRRNYADAIRAAGGVPIILPYDAALAPAYVRLIDGIVVTGGMFDIDPRRYGAEPRGIVSTKEERTTFEQALLRSALSEDLAVLGICNGMQLLAVTLGGTLVQHIPTDLAEAGEHMPDQTPALPHHLIEFAPGSTLRLAAGVERTSVNSVHHQSVMASNRYVIAARALDGVVEAIEVPGRPFCVGLQWHPEYGSSPADSAILSAFVCGAARRSQGRKPFLGAI